MGGRYKPDMEGRADGDVWHENRMRHYLFSVSTLPVLCSVAVVLLTTSLVSIRQNRGPFFISEDKRFAAGATNRSVTGVGFPDLGETDFSDEYGIGLCLRRALLTAYAEFRMARTRTLKICLDEKRVNGDSGAVSRLEQPKEI